MFDFYYNKLTEARKDFTIMGNRKIMKMLGAIYALRAKYYQQSGDHHMAVAYSDAFDMLAYACNGSLDNLRQFGWSDDAEEIIDNAGENIDFWDLEDYINSSEEYPR